MNLADIAHTGTIAAPFETGLKLVRDALLRAGLSISGELDVPGSLGRDSVSFPTQSRLLYVDSPLWLLEALALDRAAAVFLPLHVLVAEHGPETRVYWNKPAEVFIGRLPIGAALPLDEIQERVAQALKPWNGGRL
jgi:uncharacterized protein (DUF302 family)